MSGNSETSENALRGARLRLGLSLQDVAEGICSPSYLSLVETSKRQPSLRISKKLEEKLGISTSRATQKLRFSTEYDLVATAIRLGDFVSAEQRLNLVADDHERRFLSGSLKSARGDLPEAIATLLHLREATDENSLMGFQVGMSLTKNFRDSGNMLRAVQIGESVLRVNVGNPNISSLLKTELLAVLAGAYLETGELDRARELTNQGLNIANGTWEQAMALWALSNLEEVAGHNDEALIAAEQAGKLIETLDNPANVARLLNTSAYIELQSPTPDFFRVASKIDEAEMILRASPFTSDLAACLSTKADLMSFENDEASTKRFYQEALALLSGYQHELTGRIHASAANSYLRLGLTDEARNALLLAREHLESNGASRSAAVVWRQMAELYEALEEPKLALACLKATADLLGVHAKGNNNKKIPS